MTESEKQKKKKFFENRNNTHKQENQESDQIKWLVQYWTRRHDTLKTHFYMCVDDGRDRLGLFLDFVLRSNRCRQHYIYTTITYIGGTDLVRASVPCEKERERERQESFLSGIHKCESKNYATGDSRVCILVRIKISCVPISSTVFYAWKVGGESWRWILSAAAAATMAALTNKWTTKPEAKKMKKKSSSYIFSNYNSNPLRSSMCRWLCLGCSFCFLWCDILNHILSNTLIFVCVCALYTHIFILINFTQFWFECAQLSYFDASVFEGN